MGENCALVYELNLNNQIKSHLDNTVVTVGRSDA